MTHLEQILRRSPVIPVIVIDELSDVEPLAEALIAGGLRVLEVTLRTEVAAQATALLKSNYPELIVGTGTVINEEHIQQSIEAGADFMVSPGCTRRLIEIALEKDINFLPGASTPSEAMTLYEAGFNYQKFFPAEAAGGVRMLKAMAGPLPQIRFCPTGGITTNKAEDYLSLKNVVCVGGSWMVDKQLIKTKNWTEIKKLAHQASQLSGAK